MDKISFVRKRDIIIIAVILIICSALVFFVSQPAKHSTAVITVDGVTVRTIDLEEQQDGKFTVEKADGVVFEVKNKKIRIAESDCHDKLCVKTGFINRPNQVIVCLPNKVMVKIVSSSDKDYDVVIG